MNNPQQGQVPPHYSHGYYAPQPSPGPTRPGMAGDAATRYLHEIRNWMRFIGIVVIINVAAAIVIGIAVGVQVSHTANHSTFGGFTPGSTCVSHGGTDPSC